MQHRGTLLLAKNTLLVISTHTSPYNKPICLHKDLHLVLQKKTGQAHSGIGAGIWDKTLKKTKNLRKFFLR